MIELKTSDDGRYICGAFEVSDFDDADGVAAFIQQNHLMRYESGALEAEEMEEVIAVAKERTGNGENACILLWDTKGQEAVGAALVTDLDAADGYASFMASYIKETHRGMGLARILYEGRVQLLKDCGCVGVTANIADHNTPSLKAAARQGFVKTSSSVTEAGIPVGRYELRLDTIDRPHEPSID